MYSISLSLDHTRIVNEWEVTILSNKQYERIHDIDYEGFIRRRITELRMQTTPYVSEQKMSRELGQGRSYLHNINQGALPSITSFFNIIDYLDVTVDEFFAPLKDMDSAYNRLCERLRS